MYDVTFPISCSLVYRNRDSVIPEHDDFSTRCKFHPNNIVCYSMLQRNAVEFGRYKNNSNRQWISFTVDHVNRNSGCSSSAYYGISIKVARSLPHAHRMGYVSWLLIVSRGKYFFRIASRVHIDLNLFLFF